MLRLRANKVLVDLTGKSKTDGDEDAVAGCFRYLEKELGSAPVKQLCVEVGFTHYSSGTGGRACSSSSTLMAILKASTAG